VCIKDATEITGDAVLAESGLPSIMAWAAKSEQERLLRATRCGGSYPRVRHSTLLAESGLGKGGSPSAKGRC
jgi:hypothetical protein